MLVLTTRMTATLLILNLKNYKIYKTIFKSNWPCVHNNKVLQNNVSGNAKYVCTNICEYNVACKKDRHETIAILKTPKNLLRLFLIKKFFKKTWNFDTNFGLCLNSSRHDSGISEFSSKQYLLWHKTVQIKCNLL